jgi:DNA-binding CsgD family transcriptional regulator
MKVMIHEKSARQTHPGPEEGNAEATAASQGIYKPGCEMLRFAAGIDKLDTPDEVLDRLHQVAFKTYKVSVLGAMLLPARWGDWSGIELGKTVFLHKSAPKDWWGEWRELSQCHPGPGITLAHVALAPFTHTELMQKLEPLGIDRWPIELALKHGMRDGLTCPVGGRWVVTYWSPRVLSNRLSEEARVVLFMGATFAAIRLQRLVGPQVGRIGKGAALTARELAVLRQLSMGHHMRQVAGLLELGEETVRSHLKKAEAKLGVHDRTHAVAHAIRQHLIP